LYHVEVQEGDRKATFKINLRITGSGDVKCVELTQDRVHWGASVIAVLNLRTVLPQRHLIKGKDKFVPVL
jgi:hypothetical protein